MTNKEKEQYLSDMMIFRSQAFCCELSRRKEFADKMPKILYKYRAFDEWSYEMLEEPYVYLAPVKDLDDPFDCLTNPGVDGDENNQDSIGLAMVDYVIDTVCNLGNAKIDKKQARKLALACYSNGEFDEEKAFLESQKFGTLTEQEKEYLMGVLRNIDNVAQTIIGDESMKNLTNITLNPTEQVGVCSLSTKRDNKVMWSLYGDKYYGYCVEYEIPTNDKDVRFNLCPVLYKRNDDNNYIRKLVKLAVANCIRFISEGQLNRGIGCMNELFCTKDTDWAYQDEWRLIGNPEYHCKKLKIKAVYLGFRTNEKHIQKVKEVASEKGFKVYLMNAPKGPKKISYTEI